MAARRVAALALVALSLLIALRPGTAQAAATFSLSPTSGSPGTGVTVSGSGWAAGATVYVQIGSTTFGTDVACALTVFPDGDISGDQASNSCEVPNLAAASEPTVAIDAADTAIRATGPAFTVKPELSLTPAGGEAGSPASPGGSVTIEGQGFAAKSTVSGFKLDGTALTTTPTSVTTDANGEFTTTATFTVPSSTAAGNHTVSASDGSHVGSQTLTVFTPKISVSPTSGSPGTGLTVSGSGWPADATILVQIGSATADTDIACVVTAAPNGSVSDDSTEGCQVPDVPVGSEPLVAIDDLDNAVRATGSAVTVKPALFLTPSGANAGSPASPGVSVTIEGHGFAPKSTVTDFEFDGKTLTSASPSSVSTDASGNFTASVTFTVPSTTAGNQTVSATDGSSHTGTQVLKVYTPKISVSPTTGTPGTGLTVSGSGWPAHDPVIVQIGSSAVDTDIVCVVDVYANGSISADQTTNNCQVPDVPAGSEPLVAIDNLDNAVRATGSAFTIKPALYLTPSGADVGSPASPGVSVTIEGHGFAPESTVKNFEFDGKTLTSASPSSISTDANGTFAASVTFTVPATTAGNHTVSATDGSGHTGSQTLTLYAPKISVSPTSGAPGTALTISGSGWPAGDTVLVQIGSAAFDTDVACDVVAAPNGTISADKTTNNCQVPSVSTGSQPLVAIDDQNLAVIANGASFKVT